MKMVNVIDILYYVHEKSIYSTKLFITNEKVKILFIIAGMMEQVDMADFNLKY